VNRPVGEKKKKEDEMEKSNLTTVKRLYNVQKSRNNEVGMGAGD